MLEYFSKSYLIRYDSFFFICQLFINPRIILQNKVYLITETYACRFYEKYLCLYLLNIIA